MANGRCACFGGWKGDDCTEKACPADTSGNECGGLTHGKCGKSGRCRCLPGWSGGACERPACPGTPPCSARAACIVDVHRGVATCACEPPFTGPSCEQAACPSNCSLHGRCIQPPDLNAGTCQCDGGWRGPDCSARRCKADCSMRGDCNDDGECVCDPGWAGEACELPACPGDAPSLHIKQWASLPQKRNSSIARSSAIPTTALTTPALRLGGGSAQGCGEHGMCDVVGRVCVCESGWAGTDCSRKACPGNCNGRGTCAGGECLCDPHYTGRACEESVACASGCSNHGVCDELSRKCTCEAGWTGADCEHKACPPGPLGEPPCHGRGRCVEGVCECDSADGPGCRVGGRCMYNCNGHGACDEQSGTCACEVGWSGEWCQQRDCEHSCGEHGTCVQGGCECDPGWEGSTCELLACIGVGDRGCGEHGSCVQPAEPDGFAQCHCHRGWAGADCSVPDPHPTAQMYTPAPPPSPPPWDVVARRDAPRRWS
jgi:tenascin